MNPLILIFLPVRVAAFLIGSVVAQVRQGFNDALRFHDWIEGDEP